MLPISMIDFYLSHEIKVGAEYNTKHAEHRWGNGRQFDFNVNYPSGQIDVNGDGTRSASEMVGWKRFSYYREGRDNNDVDQYSIYAQIPLPRVGLHLCWA